MDAPDLSCRNPQSWQFVTLFFGRIFWTNRVSGPVPPIPEPPPGAPPWGAALAAPGKESPASGTANPDLTCRAAQASSGQHANCITGYEIADAPSFRDRLAQRWRVLPQHP